MVKANRIFVIPLGYDQSGELLKGSKALCQKLISKGQRVAYVSYGRKDSSDTTNKELFDGLDAEENVGVYILGHHGMEVSGLGGYPPAELAKLLVDLGFKHIRKLCLVACRLDTPEPAAKIEHGAGTALDSQASLIDQALLLAGKNQKTSNARAIQSRDAQLNAQSSFMGQLAQGLALCGLKPMIAGWDSFVTVCYPNNPAIKGFDPANEAGNEGRKVFSESKARGGGGPYLFGNPKDQEATRTSKRPHKVVVRWEVKSGEGVLVRADQGWSDKHR